MAGLRTRCWPFSAARPVPNSPVPRLHEEGLGLPCSQPGGLLGRSEQLGKGWGGTKGEACGGDGRSGGQGRASWLQAGSPERGHVGRGCSVGVWVGGLRTAVTGASVLPHRHPGVVGRGGRVLGGDAEVLKVAWQAAPRWLLFPWRGAAALSPNHGVTQTLSARYVPRPSTWLGVSVVVPTAGHTHARPAPRAPFCPRWRGGRGGQDADLLWCG